VLRNPDGDTNMAEAEEAIAEWQSTNCWLETEWHKKYQSEK
jgi:hypothetical protein